MYNFDVAKNVENLIEWIRDWFNKNGKDCKAIIGISGGKDSTVAAALCVKALGKDRVIGILMPNNYQSDINDSLEVVKYLGIKYYICNIGDIYTSLLEDIDYELDNSSISISEQTKINLAPRLRMTTLYAFSQSLNGRVINTCNLSENICGYSTLYGDHAGDVSLFDQLTVTEIKQIGHFLNLPKHLVDKIPSDGLTDKTDEDAFGFTYEELDKFIRTGQADKEIRNKIFTRYKNGKFKLDIINFPHFNPNLRNYILSTEHYYTK